jgi:hypothetical protein
MEKLWRGILLIAVWVGLAGCATARAPAAEKAARPVATAAERPLPYPVTYPPGYARALARGTRSADGVPGPRYWQQWTEYRLHARVDPAAKRLDGRATIVYYNRSPDTLQTLYLQLYQNLHAEGAPRKVIEEVTGGVRLMEVSVEGQPLEEGVREGPGYSVTATVLTVRPPRPVAPGDSVTLGVKWSFVIPQSGASARMGWDDDNLFFLAYWYPQMAVYDDVVGWQTDWFLGSAEFYMGYGRYELTVEAPEGWIVLATGTLQNPEEVLAPAVLERLRRAERSDEVVHVVTADDFGPRATRRGRDGTLTWRFVADTVRDVAFSLTRESFWDAVRTPVGDRDGDGTVDYARVDALYRALAPRWKNVARYARHAIAFHSRFTGFPYPWPHMTALEGSNIIGGGMEFPMFTLMGDYNERGDSALYYVTAHELGHMWFPMIVGSDEVRYAWIDEGTTTFNENQASKDFFPGIDYDLVDQARYLEMARSGGEGELMRWSDFQYSRDAYRIASYQKPATLLAALRALIGEETFLRALRSFVQAWAFKHPYPWDLFNHFEKVSGRELDWFWRTWYYETWTLDQAVADVVPGDDGTRIVVEDRGLAPMPAPLAITLEDGTVLRREIPVETWLAGARRAEVVLRRRAAVVKVEIDPEGAFPDVDRQNNVWVSEAASG